MTRTTLHLLNQICLVCTLVVCVVIPTSLVAAATYYVDVNGNNSAAGTQSQPWATIEYAMSRVAAGDVVYVNNGTYRIGATVNMRRNNLSLLANGGAVTIDGSALPSGDACVWIHDADNLTLDGFEIRGGPENGISFGPSVGTRIRNCRIHDNERTGIFVWNAVNCTISDNEIYGNAFDPNASSSSLPHGVYIARGCAGIIFERNRVYNNTWLGVHCNGNSDQANTNIVIRENVIYGNGASAGDIMNTHDSWFYNNLAYNNNLDGASPAVLTLTSNAEGATGSFRNVVCNNTIVSNQKSRAIWLVGVPTEDVGSEDCVIFNNICVSTSGASAIDNDGVRNQLGSNLTLTWSTGVLSDLFEDYAAGDYRIRNNSAAENAGVETFAGKSAPAIDITGADRVSPYDLGAYEIAGGTPIPAYTLTVLPTTGGSIAKSPNKGTYSEGEEVTVTATAGVGYRFSGWTGDLSGTTNPETLAMTSNKTIGATFALGDDNPPLVPTLTDVSEINAGCATASWTANTEPDLGGYRIYYGTLSVEQGSASQYSDSVNVVSGATKEICGLTPATYYFAVGAYDILGHASAYSVERRLDVRGPDLTAPQILVGSPEDGAVAVDPRNTTIFFVVSDGHSGVDTNAVDVLVGGIRPATMSFSGDPSSYAVLCEMAGPLPSNSTVIVQVTAADRAHPSNVASVSWSFATQSTRPAIPTGLVAQGGNDGCASLSWDPNPEPDVSGYVIYYGTSSVALGQASQYDDSMTVGSVTTRNICGLMDGVYYLALRARNTSGLCGGLSAEVSATVTDIDLQGPIPPQQVQAQETTPGCVRVTWSANPEPNIGGYVIYYGPESIAQGEQTVYTDSVNVGISTTREICGFARGVVFFAVRAYNTAGLYSDYSAEKPVNVVGPDIDGPSVLIASPADGASGVSQDAEVMFVLSDGQSGVDTNSVEVRVQGAAPARVTFAGDPSQYAVVCRPNGELPANTIVTVAVQVSDLAVPPNGASRSWSFRTASSRPSAPAGLSATGGNSGCAQLEWDPNPESDLAGYVVCFGTASVQGGQASAYTDSVSLGLVTNQALCGLLDGTYYFAMRAKNVWGLLSGLSPEASAVVTTIDTQGPLPPQQVQLAENTPGCVTVTWQPNTEPDVAGYVVLRRPFSSLTGGPSQYTDSVDVGNVTSRELCSLSQGMYYFAVRAYDTSGIRGGLSTEKWIDVVGEDVMGPKVLVGGPTNGAIEVRPTSHVFFVLSDNQTGVDSSSLYVTVNGVPPAITSFSGDPSAFAVVCAPGSELPRNTRVTVQITIADLATPPNVTRVTWNFTTTSGRPTAPTGLTAQGDDVGCLMLAWNANPETDVTGYRIYYGRSSVALGDASSYDDSLTVGLITGRTICGLVEGTYYVSLRARNEDGLLSASSIEVSSDVSNGSAQPPLPPQNVQAIETYPGCVRVSWHRSSEPDVAGYVVYHGARSVQDGAASEYDDAVNVGNKSFTQICGFTVGSYFVAVRAYDNTGAFSGFSSEKQVTVLGEDVVPPNIIVAGPRDGATGVPVNTNILFVVADGQTGVNRASIDVRINGAEPSMLSISGDSTSFAVVCEPQGGLPQNSTVTVEVNATDLAETPNASGETWSFSTGAETDGTPPVLVAQDPAPGAKNVDPASTIRLRLRDASGISVPSIEFEVNGEVVTDTTLTFHDDGDVTIQFDNETGFTPGTTVNVSFSVSDLASNVFTDDFAFEVEGDAGSAGQTIARIVPDGYWIHDVSKPLEVRNLPLGWTVKIFDTSGYEVRSFRNSQSEGMDWVWDFENDHGRRVAKSLYLIRVIDQGGSVRSSGRFVVQSDG